MSELANIENSLAGRQLIVAGSIALVATFAVSCSASQEAAGPTSSVLATEQLPAPAEPPDPTPSPIAPQTQEYNPANDYLRIPQAACWDGAIKNMQAFAVACSGQMNGKVTLVYYGGVDGEQAQQTADKTEGILRDASQGAVNLEITPVRALPAAEGLFNKGNGAGCVDIDKPQYWASVTAAIAMPETTEPAAMVVGMTNLPSCGNVAAGIADTGKGRYTDVFLGNVAVTDTGKIPSVLAHELGHLVRLGHYGTIFGQQPEGSFGDLWGVADPGATFDLNAYLQSYRYNEYESVMSRNIMGPPAYDPSQPLRLNTIQQSILDEPRLALAGQESTPGTTLLGTSPVIFDTSTPAKNDYARIPLPSSIELVVDGQKNPERAKKKFDSLVIVPLLDDSTQSGSDYDAMIWGADVYLTNEHNHIAELGTISSVSPGESQTQRVTFQGRTFDIVLANNVMQVQLVD